MNEKQILMNLVAAEAKDLVSILVAQYILFPFDDLIEEAYQEKLISRKDRDYWHAYIDSLQAFWEIIRRAKGDIKKKWKATFKTPYPYGLNKNTASAYLFFDVLKELKIAKEIYQKEEDENPIKLSEYALKKQLKWVLDAPPDLDRETHEAKHIRPHLKKFNRKLPARHRPLAAGILEIASRSKSKRVAAAIKNWEENSKDLIAREIARLNR